jgi:sulfhydrogenase subunit delta
MKKNKQIGFFSLTGCEGCYFSLLEKGIELLKLTKIVAIKNFRLMEESAFDSSGNFDASFVEGSPLTADNIVFLKKIRERSKLLIATGSCAHIGGIYHLKKYQDKAKIFEYVYGETKGIDNFDTEPLEKFVKVDFSLPGCPINPNEMLSLLVGIALDKKPAISQVPVCHECQHTGYECLLQKGEICLGPISLGGCEAICLKSRQSCLGCRGLVEEAKTQNLINKLEQNHKRREINASLEIFGIKEKL